MSTSLIWTNQNGTLTINRDNLRDFYAQSLQNYVPTQCFQVECQFEVFGMMNCRSSFDFNPGGQPNLNEVAGETVLSYSYSDQSRDGGNESMGSLTLGTTYNMDIQFTNANGSASIVITQHLVISYDMRIGLTAGNGNAVDKTIVDTYTLTVDESGILSGGLNSETTDNSTAPSDSNHMLLADFKGLARDLRPYGDALVSTGTLNIPLSNKATYSVTSGQTSTIKGVQFSDTQDLVASVA